MSGEFVDGGNASSLPEGTIDGGDAFSFGEDPFETLDGGDALSFGNIEGVELRISGRLPQLTVSARMRPVKTLTLAGVLPGLTVSMGLQYRSNTARPIIVQADALHGKTGGLQAGTAIRQQDARSLPTGWVSAHAPATPVPITVESRMPKALQRTRMPIHLAHERATPLRQSVHARHQDADRSVRPSVVSAAQAGTPVRQSIDVRHQDATRLRREARSRVQGASPTGRWIAARVQSASPLGRAWLARHERAMPPPPGISLPPAKPTEPPSSCYTPSGTLVFRAPWDGSGHLLFVCDGNVPPPGPGATVVVPIRRVYMVANNYSLRHVQSDTVLQASNLRMSLDAGSWTWSWSATLRREALPLVMRAPGADPVEVEAMVNGAAYRLRVEQVARSREFPATRVNVSGRGLAAVLASPTADVMTFGNSTLRTAQQLMSDVLTVNGVPLGWAVDWQLTDWPVPAGAWTFQGCYIDAVADIAAAAGGYVQPHPTAQTLRILPRYPDVPWRWSDLTPDLELPDHAVQIETTEWIDKPAYNRIFVGGVGMGVHGPVTRAGTGGGLLAPQVTHALITHADAHRQRGLAELSDTGRQQRISLKLQVLPETGIVVPGQLLRYIGEGGPVLGLVRAVDVDGSGAMLRQTLTVEAHDD